MSLGAERNARAICRAPIHFLHVSKTGGTALKHALKPIARDHGLVLHPHSVCLRDIPPGERCFFFLRHPLSRFVSGFLSRQRRGRPGHHIDWTEGERCAFETFARPNDMAEMLTSRDPLLYRAAHRAMNEIAHLRRPLALWLDSEAYLRSRLSDVLFVGLQENLDRDFARLRCLLGLPESLRLPSDAAAAHRAPAGADRWMTPLAEANVLAWYARDCRLFAYCAKWRKAHAVPSRDRC